MKHLSDLKSFHFQGFFEVCLILTEHQCKTHPCVLPGLLIPLAPQKPHPYKFEQKQFQIRLCDLYTTLLNNCENTMHYAPFYPKVPIYLQINYLIARIDSFLIFSRKRKLHFFFLFAQSPFMHGASGAYMRTCLVRLTIKAGLPFFSKILIYLLKEKAFIFSQLFQIQRPKIYTYKIKR